MLLLCSPLQLPGVRLLTKCMLTIPLNSIHLISSIKMRQHQNAISYKVIIRVFIPFPPISSSHTYTPSHPIPSSLQKVLSPSTSASRHRPLMIRHRTKDLELRLQVFREIHYRRDVSAAVAVIWRRPDGDDILVFEVVLVAFVDELMGAGDELEAIYVVELGLLLVNGCNGGKWRTYF
jgi:hypothetical protein